MNSKSTRLMLVSVLVLVLIVHFRPVASQNYADSDVTDPSNDPMRMFRKMLGGLMTMGQEATNRMSAGPGVYDMVKNDTALGINVMSGLVKVDRVREPGKPRALSVRVFGIPVFNRGFNQGDVMPSDRGSGPKNEVDVVPGGRGSSGSNGGSGEGEEELPLD